MPTWAVSTWPTWVPPWTVGSFCALGAEPPVAPEAATARVAADEAEAVPAGVTALTRTSSAWPTSAAVGVYTRPTAPEIAAQPRPAASQRCHW